MAYDPAAPANTPSIHLADVVTRFHLRLSAYTNSAISAPPKDILKNNASDAMSMLRPITPTRKSLCLIFGERSSAKILAIYKTYSIFLVVAMPILTGNKAPA